MNYPEPHKGLLEEPLIKRLLNSFLDKLSNPRSRLSVKISLKYTPELFAFDRDVDYLWMLIESLEKQYHIITIKLPSKKSRDKEVYDGATIRFDRDKERLVREWLKRPLALTSTERWEKALVDSKALFSTKQIAFLANNMLKHSTKTEKEVLNALHHIEKELNCTSSPLSCRTLSARYFDGDSKFLDNREAFLRQLFENMRNQIKSRPILLSVAIPENINSVLFIENQESFLECVKHHSHSLLSQTALVYSAGFRGTAERIRAKGSIVFAHLNDASIDAKKLFEAWWYGEHREWKSSFWGDLDFDGMRILASLRNIFPQLGAWREGYNAMLRFHQSGVSHLPHAAKKALQKPVALTGCVYADNVLLPLLEKTQRFLDQEVVSLSELCD